ncbi:glycosyltransferase [Mucilaginibacter sp. HMF5004]|nr:glycosyltransferase [Mucilaginibacter rivuli]
MLSPDHKISILTVTYGNRWQYLQVLIKYALSHSNVAEVVVVDNASAYSVADRVNEFNDARIKVISNTENEGSAGGYNAAINQAYQSNCANLFFMLDDDNLPAAGVIDTLISEWDATELPNNKKALFCLREDRAVHIKIAKGEDPYRYYLVANNFLGFSVFRVFQNQLFKLRDKFKQNSPYLPRVKMPYVPYGGLMFHRSLIADIGLPDRNMFVYVDDSEYTYRITQNHGTIWLIPSCRISDLEQSQGIGYKKRLFHSPLLDQWNFRTYYHVRNRMYFYSRVAIKNKIVFQINKTLYLTYLQIVSLLSSKVKEYKKLVLAINDGLAGKLGKADNDRF